MDGEDRGHDLIPMSAEQMDEIAARFELRGRTARVMRLACVDGLSLCEIAQVESTHVDGPVSYETVAALLEEARVVMWQMADRAPDLLRQILEAYQNRQPSAGKTPGDIELRSPVVSVDDLKKEDWRTRETVDVLGRGAKHDGREVRHVEKWVAPEAVTRSPAPWIFCSCGNVIKIGDKTPLKGTREIKPHPACGREPCRYHPLFVPREGEA
jgi:hypothetical protein